jgi:hypothetical protein
MYNGRQMKGILILLLLFALFIWGGPTVAVAFFSVPVLFLIAVLILAGWKVADSFMTKNG